jgi:hypothetical protein
MHYAQLGNVSSAPVIGLRVDEPLRSAKSQLPFASADMPSVGRFEYHVMGIACLYKEVKLWLRALKHPLPAFSPPSHQDKPRRRVKTPFSEAFTTRE